MTWPLAALVAAVAATGGWLAGWLTPSAALAAWVVGTLVGGGGGVPGLVALGTFFITGSLLSPRGARTTPRRAAQVLANGWTALVGAVLIRLSPSVGWALLGGGLAAAQADTWATEIGRHARRPPRLIVSGRPVAPGDSGGVTILGTLGGALGAAVVALLTQLAGAAAPHPWWVATAGFGGMLVDSVLGATLQARCRCRACDRIVESVSHCGEAGAVVGGYRWMTNDVVNAIATATGAAIALTLATGR
jgi:uncharacterized protein (TIGR00297 family)